MTTALIAKPGDIVVSLSSILAELKDKLTGAEVDALVEAILGRRRFQVAPGDLITAELINQILGDIGDLNIRVAKLEGGGGGSTVAKLRIVRVEGPTPLRIGSRVTVVGENFSVPATRNGVALESVEVTSLDTGVSTATQLVFDLPDPGLAGTGRTVTLRITNADDRSDSISFRLEPRSVVPSGTLSVRYVNPPAGGTLQPGTYDFGFTLAADVDQSSKVQLSAKLAGAAGWATSLHARDGRAITAPIDLRHESGAHFDVPFTVRVTVPAGGSASANIDVGAVEISPGTRVTPAPDLRLPLARMQSIPVPEDRVAADLLATSSNVVIDGGAAVFGSGARGRLDFSFAFRNLAVGAAATTRFDYSFSLAAGSGVAWTPGMPSTVSDTIAGDQGTGESSIRITPPSSAASTQLLVRVTAQPAGRPAVDVTYVVSLRVN